MAEATELTQAEEATDSFPWSKLPEELLVKILARVPLRSLAQNRAVCKTWNTAITGLWQCGDTLWSTANMVEEHGDKYWFVFPDGLCYNATINKYHQIKFGGSHQVEKVLATCGGLMLCAVSSRWGNGASKLSVCNPLKPECWTLLPEHPPRPLPENFSLDLLGFGIVADKDKNTFKVFTATSWARDVLGGDLADSLRWHVYDSQTKSWKVIEPHHYLHVHGQDSARFPFGQGVSYKNHLLYACMESPEIWAYNLKAETWHIIASPEGHIDTSHLENFGERLFVFREEQDDKYVEVLEFQQTSEEYGDLDGSWLEVGSIDFHEEYRLQTWQGALPDFSASTSKETPIFLTYFNQCYDPSVVFHVDEKTWYELDESDGRSWPPKYYQAMVFTPRIAACACT